jgi:hypothetical protein
MDQNLSAALININNQLTIISNTQQAMQTQQGVMQNLNASGFAKVIAILNNRKTCYSL